MSTNDDPIINEEDEESDIHSTDSYLANDYFSKDNKEYNESSPFPIVQCPKETVYNSNSKNYSKPGKIVITYKESTEKLIPIHNSGGYDNDISTNTEKIFDNYQITYTNSFDYSLKRYDVFSKKHHRERLLEELTKLDWSNEYLITEAKKATNAYEDVFEKYFDKHTSYKLANINYLFKYQLFTIDHINEYTPIIVVGDNGGLCDYILWHSKLNNFRSKVFLIPERNNYYSKTVFRKEISNTKNDNIDVLYDYFNGTDIDENPNISIELLNSISQTVMEKTENYGINCYIARKVIKYIANYNQEMMYRNFLLCNIILCFQTLNKGGNFIIKIYDSFTPFTVSLIYILYRSFEKITIVKPFSTRPYSSSRFIICQNLLQREPKILNYLKKFFNRYLSLIKEKRDVQFVIPTSELKHSENFTNLIQQNNEAITQGRIEALSEMNKYCKKMPIMKYNNMDIKKKCLDLWQIPVLEYDYRKLAQNIYSQPNKGKEKNRMMSLYEQEKECENFKYSEQTKSLIDMLINKPNVNKQKIIERNKEREVHLSYEEKFRQIFPEKGKNKTKKQEKDKKEKRDKEKKKKKEKNKEKEKEKDDELLGKKKKNNRIDDEEEEEKEEKEEKENVIKEVANKEYKADRHHHKGKHNMSKVEEALNEAKMNRKKLENQMIKVSDEQKEKLLKFKKK